MNRVSLGVQSFVDRETAAVGRTHTGASCLAEVVRLRAAGVSDVGVDLIAGLPYQDAASWQYSLEAAVGAGLTHLSVYMLEVDEDSRLGLEVLAGGVRYHAHGVPSDEVSAALYEQACGFWRGASFGSMRFRTLRGRESSRGTIGSIGSGARILGLGWMRTRCWRRVMAR